MEQNTLDSSIKQDEGSTMAHVDSSRVSLTSVTDPEVSLLLGFSSGSVQEDSPKLESLEELNTALARAIYSSDVPLTILDSKYWKEAFHLLNGNYTVPSHDMLSTELLDKEYERAKETDHQKLHDAYTLGLVIDDSPTILGAGVVNIFLTTPEPIYYKAIYPEPQKELDKYIDQDEDDTRKYLSDQIIDIIKEVGKEKIVIVITDYALDETLDLVTIRFPHIRCIGCVSHYLNLIRTDVLKLSVVTDFISGITSVMKFIQNKTTLEKCSLKLMIKSDQEDAAKLMVFLQDEDLLDFYMKFRAQNENNQSEGANAVREDVVWMIMNEHMNILSPIADAIVKSESDKCFLSDVPSLFHKLKTEIATGLHTVNWLDSNNKEYILQSIIKNRALCLQPIHYASNMLDPRYRGTDLSDEEVLSGTEFILEQANYLKLDTTLVIKNLSEFKTKTRFFGKSDTIWLAINAVQPRIWWETFAYGQVLRPIATRILSVSASAVPSKKKMSAIGNIPAETKRQLDKEQFLKLISIRSNLHCRDSNSDDDDEEETLSIESNADDVSEKRSTQGDLVGKVKEN